MKKKLQSIFCAFCRAPRVVTTKRHIRFSQVLVIGAICLLLSYLLWWELHPKAFVLFGLFSGIAEVLAHFRWRLNLMCPHCGFDPVLYAKSHDAAAERVRQHLARRKSGQMGAVRPLTWPTKSRQALPELSKSSRHVFSQPAPVDEPVKNKLEPIS